MELDAFIKILSEVFKKIDILSNIHTNTKLKRHNYILTIQNWRDTSVNTVKWTIFQQWTLLWFFPQFITSADRGVLGCAGKHSVHNAHHTF